jgi:hypothetical protein
MKFVRINCPEPDEPRQARRCTTRDCDYTPRVEGECWLCPHCVEKRRREREALRDACEAALETLDHAELNRWEQEVADRLRAALAFAKEETS